MIAVNAGTWIAFLQGDGGQDVKRRKARLGDALTAQSCIDREIPLLTRDRDFRALAGAAGLNLLIRSAAD